VVHADDCLPGEGFFALGRGLGFTFDDEPAFWKERLGREVPQERWRAKCRRTRLFWGQAKSSRCSIRERDVRASLC
jgi:hypothetical protein